MTTLTHMTLDDARAAAPPRYHTITDGLLVTATKAEAILYTVRVESRDRKGVLTFWATAVFGNLGAHGMQFRLIRQAGRWVPEPTGLSVLS